MALWFALVLSLLTSECSAEDKSSVAQSYTLDLVAKSNVEFANILYQVISRSPGDVFFSPFSIQTILALTSLGAGGSTAQQMQTGLRLPADQQDTKYGFQILIENLQSSADVILSVANKIYLEDTFVPNPSFLTTAQQFFNSDLESVDFQYSSENVRQVINSWVADNTNNKIQDLLARGFVGSSTVMVLVNAIYFKGSWTWFNVRDTSPQPFYVNGYTPVTVSMMSTEKRFRYKDWPNVGVQVLELPYIGGDMSFIVILPYQLDGISALEAWLPYLRLSDLASGMSSTLVRVSLPKFLLEQSIDLEDTLKKLGMTYMFSGYADFSGISQQPIAVSKVVHKAYIEVNEKGTEAAAATGVGIMLLSAPMPTNPITFNANHPFIFYLRHNPTNTILFMGRHSSPKPSNESARTDPTGARRGTCK